MQCLLLKGDGPIVLTWFHNSKSATSTPGVKVTPLGQFVLALVIENVTPEHAGNYTCKASSGPTISVSHSDVLVVHGNI